MNDVRVGNQYAILGHQWEVEKIFRNYNRNNRASLKCICSKLFLPGTYRLYVDVPDLKPPYAMLTKCAKTSKEMVEELISRINEQGHRALIDREMEEVLFADKQLHPDAIVGILSF